MVSLSLDLIQVSYTMNLNTPPGPPRNIRPRSHQLPQVKDKSKKSAKFTTLDEMSRVSCNIENCKSSFRRSYDLVRHKKSIHGPKHLCMDKGCRYSTGRPDKMNEHRRKMHKNTSESTIFVRYTRPILSTFQWRILRPAPTTLHTSTFSPTLMTSIHQMRHMKILLAVLSS